MQSADLILEGVILEVKKKKNYLQIYLFMIE